METKFLIVDDERLSRQYIRNLILEFCPGGVVFEGGNIKEALVILEREDISILFLDVRMSGADGFQLLQQSPHRRFETIFVTAYSEYAIQAIRNGAADYLLKPIRKTEFKGALFKVMELLHEKRLETNAVYAEREDYMKRQLAINHLRGTTVVKLKDVIFLRADNTYTHVVRCNESNLVVSKPIRWFEGTLEAPWFFRIHKSIIINTMYLAEFTSVGGHFVIMANGERLPVSRYRLSDFHDILKKISL